MRGFERFISIEFVRPQEAGFTHWIRIALDNRNHQNLLYNSFNHLPYGFPPWIVSIPRLSDTPYLNDAFAILYHCFRPFSIVQPSSTYYSRRNSMGLNPNYGKGIGKVGIVYIQKYVISEDPYSIAIRPVIANEDGRPSHSQLSITKVYSAQGL